MKSQAGQSVIELLLSAALFMILATASVTVVLQGLSSNRLGSEYTIASQFGAEGIEADRSIRNQAFINLVNSAGTGIIRNGSNVWAFSGANNITDKYTRVLTVTDVQRDVSGNIVASAGTVDPSTKKITSTTSWNFTTSRAESLPLSTYLTRWREKKGGLLVYGDGGTTTDAIKYRVFDALTNTWGTATAGFDVDGATTNKALRVVRMYSSSTRNEKIALTRHYNGTAQFIYATVWNGTSWGTPTQLSTWTAATFLDVTNFDGAYLSDGTFMAIYSDNTNIPKHRIWNGATWATQASLTALTTSHTPVFITVANRPGTNEVMTGVFTNGAGTATAGSAITEYWNGTTWSAITTHSALSPLNTKRTIDFEWSSNTLTTGALIYADSTTDKNLTVRICVVSAGVCTWGTAVNAGTAQTNNIAVLNIEPRPGANEFQACDKDAGATPLIICYKITFSGSVPTITNPTNPTMAAATDVGIQRSFDIDWKAITGDIMIGVYSDNTAVPKFKKYTASTSTWDAAATTIPTVGFTPGVIKVVRIIPQDQGDDMIAFMSDANLDLYSIFWDGVNNIMYTTPAGLITSQHGINGSATADFWFDFAWDKF